MEIKKFIKKNQKDIVLLIGVILISLLSFALGFIISSVKLKEPLMIEQIE